MKGLDFGRFALTSCVAAAMLAGCGGSQPPIGATGEMPPSTDLHHAEKSPTQSALAPRDSVHFVYD